MLTNSSNQIEKRSVKYSQKIVVIEFLTFPKDVRLRVLPEKTNVQAIKMMLTYSNTRAQRTGKKTRVKHSQKIVDIKALQFSKDDRSITDQRKL